LRLAAEKFVELRIKFSHAGNLTRSGGGTN